MDELFESIGQMLIFVVGFFALYFVLSLFLPKSCALRVARIACSGPIPSTATATPSDETTRSQYPQNAEKRNEVIVYKSHNFYGDNKTEYLYFENGTISYYSEHKHQKMYLSFRVLNDGSYQVTFPNQTVNYNLRFDSGTSLLVTFADGRQQQFFKM